MQSNSMADVVGVYCLGIFGKLVSLNVYPMLSLYPMESLDLSRRYLSKGPSLKPKWNSAKNSRSMAKLKQRVFKDRLQF